MCYQNTYLLPIESSRTRIFSEYVNLQPRIEGFIETRMLSYVKHKKEWNWEDIKTFTGSTFNFIWIVWINRVVSVYDIPLKDCFGSKFTYPLVKSSQKSNIFSLQFITFVIKFFTYEPITVFGIHMRLYR